MKYKLAIFDLDGTILDTLDDLANSVNFALNQSNLPKRSVAEVRKFVGNGIRKLIERAVPNETKKDVVDKVFEDFASHYKIHCADNTKSYDGIDELLNKLKNDEIKVAVVSNKADFAVQDLCKEYFPNIFDFAVGEKAEVRKKPAPDSVNTVLETLNIDKKDAVYIGDSEVDIETAKNAHMECISVNWGFRDEDFLKENGAKRIISSPAKLYEEIAWYQFTI